MATLGGHSARTVRDATRDLMRELGLTTVFGNPGSTEIPFLTEWPSDFRYVLALQESSVVAMADGYAQVSRRPVLVNLHSAGGVGHGLGQVFNAFRGRAPLIIIAGQQIRSMLPEDPYLGATDAPEFPRPYVKWAIEPARAQDVPAAIARAYHLAMQPPQGPVFLSVPMDDWDVETDTPITARPRIPGFGPDPAALADLVAALGAAERPAIVAGGAVDADDAVLDLVALAQRLGAGVWAAPTSVRCSFPENHRLFRGFLQPERKSVAAALGEHDLVLVIGAPAFTYHVYRGEAERALPPLFVLSDDQQILARTPTGTGIPATPKLAITALLAALEDGQASRTPLPAMRRPPAPIATGNEAISAQLAYATLAQLLPANAIVVEETASHRNVLHEQLPITSTDAGFLSFASGTLGYGLPAAVGAALARPDRKVVAVLGDGSSMYCVQALWTAAKEDVPVTFVILDNGQYAALRVLGEASGGTKLPGIELGGIDFVSIANGFGVTAHSIADSKDLEPALADALADDRPHLLHITIDPDPGPLY